MTKERKGTFLLLMILLCCGTSLAQATTTALKVGASALPITLYGQNPDWDRPVTPSGVWGQSFTDRNHNGRWDPGFA